MDNLNNICTTTDIPQCDITAIHEEVVARVRQAMLHDSQFYELSNLFKLLADSTRLKILFALSQEDMCVCDLAALLGMTKSAISHQLKSLRLAGLVNFTKAGKVVYYSLVDGPGAQILLKSIDFMQ